MTDDEQKKKIRFQVVDVTNYESMKAAADMADDPVCIATEGLTVYLTADETHQLGVNIRRILSEKGGCWLNADVETLEYYMAVYKAAAGDEAMELLLASRKSFGGGASETLDELLELCADKSRTYYIGGHSHGCLITKPYERITCP